MDEIGPLPRIPHREEGWFPERRPGRIPAEYPRQVGTVYSFLSLDVFHQRLQGRVDRTQPSRNGLPFLQQVRRRYPPEQVIYLIGDGASNPWTPEIRTGAKANHVRRVLTPPHARYLNPVECHAGDLPKLAGAGEEFTTPREVGRALDRAVTYRNHERKRRGKRFRDTGRNGRTRRRRAKCPIGRRPR